MSIQSLSGCALLSAGPARRRAGARPGEAHRLVGQGLLQGRGRRAVRGDQEVRGQDRNVKIELSQYAPQDMIPKTVAALDAGNAARRGLCRRLRLPGHRQVGLRRQARGRHRASSTRCARKFAPSTRRDHLPLQRQDQEAAYYAFPIKQQTMHIQYWKDMLAEAGFKETRHPDRLEGLLELLVRQGAAGYRQKTGKRAFGIGQPLGVDSSDSFYSFLTFMDALQRQAGQRQRQAAGRRSGGAPGPDQRADRLHRRSTPRAARRRRRRTGRTRTTTSPSTTRRPC